MHSSNIVHARSYLCPDLSTGVVRTTRSWNPIAGGNPPDVVSAQSGCVSCFPWLRGTACNPLPNMPRKAASRVKSIPEPWGWSTSHANVVTYRPDLCMTLETANANAPSSG